MAPVAALPHQPQQRHVVLFPFMSKGHTIPLLQLAHLLLRRDLAAVVTVITTPSNFPFIARSLSGTSASVVPIPFPTDSPGVPAGVESTDQLPSISHYFHLANATKLMRPNFERTLLTLHPSPTLLISDGFLGWTLHSARALRVPRLVFFGMSNYAMTVCGEVGAHNLATQPWLSSDDEPFPVLPAFPWIHLTRNDLDSVFKNPSGPLFDFIQENFAAAYQSHGLVMNSFYELEPVFVDYWNRNSGLKAWCVGPLCLAQPEPEPENPRPAYLRWLDRKLAEGKSVIYVAFGTQAEISQEQLKEIAMGLEESGVNYLWVVRDYNYEEEEEGLLGLKEEERGIIVREWVEQRKVLGHGSVEGFVSHCGWNSVIESVSFGVAVGAWPMMAEQHLNARMVVEELKVGLRVETCDGSVKGFVRRDGLKRTVRELMEGEKGKAVRNRVRELSEAARMAADDGGSSWRTLELVMRDADACQKKQVLAEN